MASTWTSKLAVSIYVTVVIVAAVGYFVWKKFFSK